MSESDGDDEEGASRQRHPADGDAQEETMRELQGRLRFQKRLLDAVGEAIVAMDPAGAITYWNRAAERLYGWTAEEVLGRPIVDVTPTEDSKGLAEDVLARIAKDESWSGDITLRRKDGSTFLAHATSTPVHDDDGRLTGIISVSRDVTGERRARQEADARTTTLETLHRVNMQLASELDLEDLVQAVTDAGTELTGAAFGAFFYNEDSPEGGEYLLYTLSGAPREAFEAFPHPRATDVFGPTFRGEAVIRSDDITKDPRYGNNPPHHGMPEGHLPVRSYLAAPVVSRSGEVLGGLFFGHPERGVFGEEAERLVEGIAAQAAVAIDNARLYRAAQRELSERRRAQSALKESQERLRTIIQAEPECVKIVAPDGRLEFMNPAGLAMIEADDLAQVQGVHLDAVLATPDRPHFWEAHSRVLDGEEQVLEFEVVGLKGTRRWMESRAVPLRNEAGEVAAHLAVTRDITDRVRAEEAILESEARYRALTDDVLDTSDVATFILDSSFRVVWVNQATERYFGLRREEVLGADKRALIEEHIQHIFKDPGRFADRVLATYDDNTYEERFECHVLPGEGREERWLQHWSQPIATGLYAGGRIEHYTDITERKRAEMDLESAHKRARGILESITDAFIAVDRKWRFTYVNKRAEVVLDRSRDELLGRSLWDAFPDILGTEFDTMNRLAMRERRSVSYEEYYPGLDAWFEVHAYPSDQGLSIYFRDVTHQKRAEEELDAARREVEATEKLAAMGTLVSGVAHEIRTPLTYISNNAFLIGHALKKLAEAGEGDADAIERVRELCDEITGGVERANRLVNDLREFTKRKLGEREPARLERVVAEAVRLFRTTHRGSASVEARLDPCPEMELDRLQVQQVVLNLLENATDASAPGGAVEVVTHPVRGGGRIIVRDDGPGIPDDVVDRIFDPFYTTKEEGTGLGLAIVKRIVTVHGGTIDVDTAPGKGTTFTVTLPANDHESGG